MMNNVKELFKVKDIFKDRTIGFWIGLAASAAGLVIGIIYIASNYGDITFSMAAFLLTIFAALSFLLTLFTDIQFAPVLSPILLAAAMAVQFNACIYTITDIMNGINFYGGNHFAAIFYLVAFAGLAIVATISCFMNQRKDKL